MKKIAITGVIGSGKSEVSKILEQQGKYVIYTDKINSQLLCDEDYIKKLSNIFPNAVNNNTVNKSEIRKEISENNEKRLALNTLSHKEIKLRVDKLVQNFNGKEIFCEIPLIVESNMVDYFDEIWCVTSDKETKIKRIVQRDNVTYDDAKKIVGLQKSDDELKNISNKIIENNGNLKELEENVKKNLN